MSRLASFRRRMPRVPAFLLAAAFLVAFGVAAPGSAAAQEAGDASIVGSWSLGFPNDDPSSRHLASFLPGGVVLMTNAPVFAEEGVSGDQIFSTAGHGAWEAREDGSYAFIVVFLYFDEAEENWGTLTIEGSVTLDADGDSFSGTFDAIATDEDGGPLFMSEGEPLTGARIRPRTSDAASPVQ